MSAGGDDRSDAEADARVGSARCAKRSGNIRRDRREVMLGYSTKQ
jgi:hypothetical protein